MKKLLVFTAVLFLLSVSVFPARAVEIEGYSFEKMNSALDDEAKQSLERLGADTDDAGILSSLSFENVFGEIGKTFFDSFKTALRGLCSFVAVMLLGSLFQYLKNTARTSAMQSVLSLCCVLCLSLTITVPALSVIEAAQGALSSAANFTLAYIPAMALLLSVSGQTAAAASYHSMMIFASQFLSRLSAEVIAPFLKLLLALSVSASVSTNINLSSAVKSIAKFSKWTLAFVMTVFTSVLSLRQILGSNVDSVARRAVRFSLSSLVPVVGSALSEAYKSVEDSLSLLKSGVGVFAILAVFVTFLPVLVKCLLWQGAIFVGKTVGELLSQRECCVLLDSVGAMFSILFALLLSVMTAFIISTASLIMLGGGS